MQSIGLCDICHYSLKYSNREISLNALRKRIETSIMIVLMIKIYTHFPQFCLRNLPLSHYRNGDITQGKRHDYHVTRLLYTFSSLLTVSLHVNWYCLWSWKLSRGKLVEKEAPDYTCIQSQKKLLVPILLVDIAEQEAKQAC